MPSSIIAKLSKYRAKLAAEKTGSPLTWTATKRHLRIKAPEARLAFGAVHNISVPASRLPFEKCAVVLYILLGRPITRKLTFKFMNTLRLIGDCFLGFYGDLLNLAHLVEDERKSLSENFSRLDAADSRSDLANRRKDARHKNPPVVDESCVRASDSTTCGDTEVRDG